jgi:hypothetical protein
LEIRDAVLDTALEHSPYPDDDLSQKPSLIERLLPGTKTEVKHPVVREMEPESEKALRQWTVRVGDHQCNVAMFLVKYTSFSVYFQTV